MERDCSEESTGRVGREVLAQEGKGREGGRRRIKAGLGAKEGRQAGRSSKPARA